MKKIKIIMCCIVVGLSFASCNKPAELPPTSPAMNINANYKMPESTVLMDEERAIINAIRNEHDNSKP